MADNLSELKHKLGEATERLKSAGNPDGTFALGGEVRELERQIEAAKGPDTDPPRYLRA